MRQQIRQEDLDAIAAALPPEPEPEAKPDGYFKTATTEEVIAELQRLRAPVPHGVRFHTPTN